MVIARTVTETFSVVLESDKGSAHPTTFRIRALPHRVMLSLPKLKDAEQVELLVRAGVVGWTGLADAKGVPVEAVRAPQDQVVFGVEVDRPLTTESYDALPISCLSEIANEVITHNTLTKDDVGK